jgi:heme-degrading monooxygenase HmoA
MVRVMIERHLKRGKKGDLLTLLRELRTAALHHPGYITGETLSRTEDSSIVSTLSTWRSLNDWQAWEKSEPRIRLYKKIEPLLGKKPKVTVYQIVAAEEK